MLLSIFWGGCALLSLIWADEKGLEGWKYFILALFVGPIALLAVWVSSPKEKKVAGSHQGGRIKEMSRMEIQGEVISIRYTLAALQQRLDRLEQCLNVHPDADAKKAESVSTPAQELYTHQGVVVDRALGLVTPEVQLVSDDSFTEPIQEKDNCQVADLTDETPKVRNDVDFTRFWLPRIGMGVLLLGIGFFITYSFQYMGAWAKVALGYVVAAGMFFLGGHVEKKEGWHQHGRVILIGAWALLYFMTFAIYHFPAVKIVQNQGMELCLLSVVAIAMICHAVRYKSELVVSGALLFAYLTTTIVDVTMFTFFSSVVLALALLAFVFRFQWYRCLLLGISLTFGIHFFWVSHHLPSGWDGEILNLLFLTGYWVVFMLGAHILSIRSDETRVQKICIGINGFVLALYLALGIPRLFWMFPDMKFVSILGMGGVYLILFLVMRVLGKRIIALSNAVIGISAVTLAFPFQCAHHDTLMLWFIEAPFLMMIGYLTKERIYRFLSYGAAVIAVLWALIETPWINDVMYWRGGGWSPQALLYLTAGVSMAVCFYLNRYLFGYAKEDWPVDSLADYIFSLLAPVFFAIVLGIVFRGLLRDILALVFVCGVWWMHKGLDLPRFRWFAYGIGFFPIGHIIFSQPISWPLNMMEVLVLALSSISLFGPYAVLKLVKRDEVDGERLMLFLTGSFFIILMSYTLVPRAWLSFGWSLWAGLALLLGITFRDRLARFVGIGLSGFVLGRLIFIEEGVWPLTMAHLSALLLFGIMVFGSYVALRLTDRDASKGERLILWILGVFCVAFKFYEIIPSQWISVGWGVWGSAFALLGIIFEDRVVRISGMCFFGLVLVRLFVVDIAHLDMIFKIITFIGVGAAFLGVSFVYNQVLLKRIPEKNKADD